MKNFTKTITNKTLFKPTRWLIMALMLLVGTSSVWSQDMYVAGTMTNWATGQVKLSTASSTHSGYYYATFTVEAGTHEYRIKESGNNWWCSTYNTTNSSGVTYTSGGNNCDNIKIKTTSAGTLEIYHNKSSDQTFAKFYIPCTPATSITSAELQPNGTISLIGNFTTCGAKYHGFQWRIKDNDWCLENDPNENSGYVTIGNTDVNGSETASFTPKDGGTYEFRTYIATTSPWLYSTSTDEVSTCTELPDDAYALSSISAEWTGSDITPTISKKDENYPTPTITYNEGSALPNKSGEYAIKATVSGDATYCNKEFDLGTFTITCPTIAAPAITTSATVCEGTKVTLSSYNGDNTNTVKWYSSQEFNSEVTEQVTLTDDDTKYYAKAYHEASGCYSSEYSTLTFTVNPKPIITITGNNSAVLYEDVTLTATGNNITDVTWIADKGTITKDATDPKKAVLTYDQTGTVTVNATAISEDGCTSTAATKTVKFGEEDCNSTTTTVQQTVGKTKIIVDNPQNWSTMKCYAWRTSDKKKILGDWSGTNMDKNGNNYEIVIDFAEKEISESDKIQVIFNNGSSQTVDSDEVSCNKIYRFSIGSKSGDKYSFTSQAADIDPYTEPVEVTVDPEISAPAAKTISVSSTEGGGNIIFSGQVVKTGCADALTYGFAYSTDANADKNNWTKVECANTGNTAGTQYNGEKTGIEEDGTYYVCAYITNSAGTSYGAVTEITVSTKKTLITSVTLTHVKDANGTKYEPSELANLTYCVGDEVWFELTYEGSKFIPENNVGYKWTTCPGNGLIGPYNGNKYKFTITGSGTIGISLRNEANVDGEGNPTWAESNSLKFNTHPEPAAPYISIYPVSGIICEGSTATIKVENPSIDCSYKLVEDADFTPYTSGDLTYTVQDVAKYYVVAQHKACTNNEYTSNQVEINQIISTSATISIKPDEAVTTTPWEPVTITVNPQEGYVYELSYTGNNLAGVDGVIIKQNGDSYTYYIPRPNSWGTGDSNSRTTIGYGIKAQLKVDGEASECTLNNATAIIQLKDEDNENCE